MYKYSGKVKIRFLLFSDNNCRVKYFLQDINPLHNGEQLKKTLLSASGLQFKYKIQEGLNHSQSTASLTQLSFQLLVHHNRKNVVKGREKAGKFQKWNIGRKGVWQTLGEDSGKNKNKGNWGEVQKKEKGEEDILSEHKSQARSAATQH